MTDNVTDPDAAAGSWRDYYEKTGARPPRETLIFALDRFDEEGLAPELKLAADLGCGSGRDTVEIVRRGWQVLAVDAEQDAIDGLRAREEIGEDAALETLTARLQEAALPERMLINSSFVLPLIEPQNFPDLWNGILMALMPGGRISCQLYGNRDSWTGRPGMCFFTREGVEALLNPLDIEHFREEEEDSTTPRGTAKHWHIFHIVARMPLG